MKSCCYCHRPSRTTRPECFRCRNNIKSRKRNAEQKLVGRIAGAFVAAVLLAGCST